MHIQQRNGCELPILRHRSFTSGGIIWSGILNNVCQVKHILYKTVVQMWRYVIHTLEKRYTKTFWHQKSLRGCAMGVTLFFLVEWPKMDFVKYVNGSKMRQKYAILKQIKTHEFTPPNPVAGTSISFHFRFWQVSYLSFSLVIGFIF